jgi:hypothetical protein
VSSPTYSEDRSSVHDRRRGDPPHWLTRWWPLIAGVPPLVGGFLVWLGITFSGPGEKLTKLSHDITQNREQTLLVEDTLRTRTTQILEVLEVFALDLCIRRQTDPYIYRRLKCRELLNNGQ